MPTRSHFRKLLLAMTGCCTASGVAADAPSQEQVLYPAGSQQSFVGPAEYFTGEVQVDVLFPETDATHYSGAYVTFQPGARTAWHLHPAGQHMVVTDGIALTGTRDGRIIEFGEGETVWCPPDIDHWHGATPDAPMTHLVITGSKDGENVIWKEKVDDGTYLGDRQRGETTADVDDLSARQQAIVPIAAFTASGNLDALKTAVGSGLDDGLTVNEIKEIPIHLYAYAGFPRSLNALGTVMGVVEERRARGIEDETGEAPRSVPGGQDSLERGREMQTRLAGQPVTGPLFEFAPGINELLQAHLFGDLFARGVLDERDRELVTVSALASMDGVESQLKAHIGIATNVGITRAELSALAGVLGTSIGSEQQARVEQAIQVALSDRDEP